MLYLRGPKRRCCQCLVVGSGRDDHSSIRFQERFQEIQDLATLLKNVIYIHIHIFDYLMYTCI